MVAPISQIEVFSNASVLPNGKISLGVFPVNNSAQRSATLRGENFVKITFNYGKSIPIPAFAFIEYDGQLFFTKEIYRPEPKGNNVYEYNVKFVSFDNLLSKPQAYRRVVVGSGAEQQTWNEPDIEIVGTLQTIAEVVCESIKASAVRYDGVFADMLSKVEIVSSEVSVNSESKAFSFQGQKISQVLESVANDYEIDYWFEQVGNMTDGITKMVLHFCKYERTDIDPLVLSDKTRVNRLNPYDPVSPPNPLKPTVSGGLDECTFANEWSGVVQRITPFGSERNITRQQAIVDEMFVSYGKRLRLEYDHSCTIDGTTYPHAYAVKDEDGNTIPLSVDENGAVYVPGVTTGEETIEKYDDIYPRGHFRVTHVTQRGVDTQIFTVYAIPTEERNGQYVDLTDAEIDAMQADPNKRLFPIEIQDGQTLSLHFESGFLNGREFEVANKSAKMVCTGDGYKVDPDNVNAHWIACFEINPEGDNNDSPQVPYGNMVPRGKLDVLGYEGDMFAIFNMDMPPYYKESAMNELAQKAYDEITAILSTRPEVKCKGNEEFFMRQNLCLGLRVKVTSDLFGEGTEFVSRVTNYSHSLSRPNNVDFRLCSSRVQGSISVLKGAIADQTQAVSGVQQTARSLSRRAFRDSQEMIGMLQSIIAEMMVVGVERNQFSFTMGIECLESAASPLTRKFSGLRITAGEIQHTQEPYIKDNWEGHYTVDATTLYVDKNNHSIGTDATEEIRNTPYYLYAVIDGATGKANMELWAEKKDGENDEAYLLLGILSSEFLDGTTSLRVFNRSNGFTQIAGGTITTEQLQDPTRQLIIDMSSNPPRIIARNGAEIIGNIKFKASDEMTAEEQLEALGLGVDAAKDAADAANEAAKAAQAEAKQAGEAAKEYADGLTKALGESLQNQIDGVIDSYFMEGVPYSNFRPSSDWGTTEVKNRHLGDTYTNILKNKGNLAELDGNGLPMWIEQGLLSVGSSHYGKTFEEQRAAASNYCRTKTIFENYNGLTIGATPAGITKLVILYDANKQYVNNYSWIPAAQTLNNAGTYPYISIIFAKDDSSAITPSELAGITSGELTNPEAGKSWRWCNNDDTDDSTFHWHEIADSDAVLALQKAAEAQDTADEKRRVFVSQPTPPYEVGDLWAQGGASGQDILKCTTARATGSFQQSDWAAASSALSAAADAKQAANNAQTAANNAQTAVNNVTDDGIISGGTEKANLKREWQAIAGANLLGNTDGSYFKALSQATKYSVNAYTMQQFFSALKYAMEFILQYPNADTTIKAGIPTSASSSIKTRDDFNMLWKNYYDAEIVVLNAVSDKIKSAADAAQATADGLKWTDVAPNKDIEYRQSALHTGLDYTPLLLAAKAGTYIPNRTGEYDERHNGIQGCVVAFKKGYKPTSDFDNNSSYVFGIFHWGDTIVANVDIDIYACKQTYNYVYGKFEDYIDVSDEQLEQYDYEWYLYGITILTQTTSAISALDYLRAALTDGSTEIAGGLTMTNVLMLKNLQGAVTAGMSGLTKLPSDSSKSENVLMWGGGTYEDAYNAAESADYYKKGTTTPITTLLKKDGTGKIGIFKISDTQAIIDVPNQGKVLIDASSSNGGIFIKDSNFNDKISIIPRSITNSGLKPADSKDWESTKTGSVSASSGSSYMQYGSVNRVNVSGTAISFNSKGTLSISSIVASYSNLRTTVQGNTTNANTVITVGIRNGTGSPIIEYTMSSSSQTLGSGVNVEIPSAGTYYVFFGMKTQCNNGEGKIVNGHADTKVTIKAHFVPSYIPKTIICTDGLISAFNSESYFMIQNTSSGQKIYAKGLSTTKGTSGSGELYVSSSFIEAFKDFINYFKNEWVPDVRSIGSNVDKANNMITKANEVLNKISETSLLANS